MQNILANSSSTLVDFGIQLRNKLSEAGPLIITKPRYPAVEVNRRKARLEHVYQEYDLNHDSMLSEGEINLFLSNLYTMLRSLKFVECLF